MYAKVIEQFNKMAEKYIKELDKINELSKEIAELEKRGGGKSSRVKIKPMALMVGEETVR